MKRKSKMLLVMSIFLMIILPPRFTTCQEFNKSVALKLIDKSKITQDTNATRPFELSYLSSENSTPTPLESGDYVFGEDIVFTGVFPDIPDMPELDVISINYTLGLLKGIYYQRTGELIIPDESYDPFSGTIQIHQFSWEQIDGIKDGDVVDLEVDFTNTDCDVMAWWAGTDNSSWAYANNLIGDSMATGEHPEVGSITADRDGSLIVGIFDYDCQSGNYTITADSRVGVYEEESSDGNTSTIDLLYTYDLIGLDSYVANLYFVGHTNSSITFVKSFVNLKINSAFPPVVKNVKITGVGPLVLITWDVYDQNANDCHLFEVLISADDGFTYQLIASGLNETQYIWNSTGFIQRSYQVQIRATDELGLVGVGYSETFAGDHIIPPELFNPSVNSPGYMTLEEGSIGYSIDWQPEGTQRIFWIIKMNESMVREGEWLPGAGEVTYSLDGLAKGVYFYKILLSYDQENWIQNVVRVDIVEAQGLTLEEIMGLSFILASFGALAVLFLIIIRRRPQN